MSTTYQQRLDRERQQRVAEHKAAEEHAEQERQAQLDAWKEENDRLRTERLAKLDAEWEAKRLEHAQRELATLKADYRRRYLAQPGTTEADFDRAWPMLLEQHRNRETMEAAERERQSLRATGRYTM